jgi:RES domain-containing protein
LDLRSCASLARRHIAGTSWHRAVAPHYMATALSAVHTPTITSRFSPGSPTSPAFQILYLAENPMVALFEARALFGSPAAPGGVVAHPARALATLPISVSVSDIADLTEAAQATILSTNAQELTGDWVAFRSRPGVSPHSGTAPTQELGQALFNLGYKGFVSFSAQLPDYKILGVFTTRLVAGADSLAYSYHDPHGVLITAQIP